VGIGLHGDRDLAAEIVISLVQSAPDAVIVRRALL